MVEGLWTRHRLRLRLAAAFAPSTRGRISTTSVARAVEVSPRTVRRWLAGPDDQVVGMSPRNRARVLELTDPSIQVLEQERRDDAYAWGAIRGLERKRPRILPEWRAQQWVKQHQVVILERGPVRQVAIARLDGEPARRLSRRGPFLGRTVVPSRFHATVLRLAVLAEVRPWRVVAAKTLVVQGNSGAWTVDAPAVNLNDIAARNSISIVDSTVP